MFDAVDVAGYFINKDINKEYFNKKIVKYNNRSLYEGNVRLNKYLFLAQVVFLAKYEKKLIKEDFSAYANGPVIENIMVEYARLIEKNNYNSLPQDIQEYLDKIYFSLENATYEELIEITHEDPEWINLQNNTYNAPIMNLEKNIDIYKKRYKGLIAALKI